MGLDMYLYRKIYVQNWEHTSVDNHFNISITRGSSPVNINTSKITYIVEDVGYWRKANAIHHWFVENVQNGQDDCRDYYVTEQNFSDLKDLCLQVLENPAYAKSLLPTSSGFFFGSTSYDDYYLDDLRATVEICNNCLAMIADKNNISFDFYYHSSW